MGRLNGDYIVEFRNDHVYELRESIVRCRDCMYAVSDATYCTEGCCDKSEYRNVEPSGFCAWGERVN